MATAIVPPINAVLLGYGLKLIDLPIKRVAPHRNKQLRRRIHGLDDTACNITVQA
ncbi:MAG: hypothetical protein IPJ36_11290 [Simplicispira sp.]|nr:hypothetical protein [Simplicispira sp.]